MGAGPILALSDVGAASAVVRRLARAIAARAHRDLAVLHVEGQLKTAALALAEERRAALVAIGAWGAGGITGALRPRPWAWVAAHARQPVLIVPLDHATLDRREEATRALDGC
jgi:nucleotide-binding universal stress UspA family protein